MADTRRPNLISDPDDVDGASYPLSVDSASFSGAFDLMTLPDAVWQRWWTQHHNDFYFHRTKPGVLAPSDVIVICDRDDPPSPDGLPQNG